eukprot:7976655-Alexandrium_andersonii.AAC.1
MQHASSRTHALACAIVHPGWALVHTHACTLAMAARPSETRKSTACHLRLLSLCWSNKRQESLK